MKFITLLLFSTFIVLTSCQDESHQDLTDFTPRGTMIRFSCPDAKLGYAYAMRPRITSSKYLVILHERWGLDNYTKKEVERWFDALGQQVNVVAPDLFDGKHAATPEEAATLMNELSPLRGNFIVRGVYGLGGIPGIYTVLGRSYGGTWALKAGILGLYNARGVVLYYGTPINQPSAIVPLEAEVLGIYAQKDKWITPAMVTDFQSFMAMNNRKLEVRPFNAPHGFASPGDPNYQAKKAQEADAIALAFIKQKLGM